MKFKKEDLIRHLTEASTARVNGSEKVFSKNTIFEGLQSFIPKNVNKQKLDTVRNVLSESASKSKSLGKLLPTVESVTNVWNAKTNVKNIINKILVEAAVEERGNPNAFRLNLKTIVMDKCHAKFSLNKNNQQATCEILYPNANQKITVKVSVENADDILQEIGLEDEQYTGDFGGYILSLVDEAVGASESASDMGGNKNATQIMLGNKSGGLTGFPNTWEKGSDLWESDVRKLENLFPLVEEMEDDGSPIVYSVPENKFKKNNAATAKKPTIKYNNWPSVSMKSDYDKFSDLMGMVEAAMPMNAPSAGDVNEDDLEADVSLTGEGPADPSLDMGGAQDEFGAGDFAIDAGADTTAGDFTADFGGDFGGAGGGAGGGGMGGDMAGGDVNVDGAGGMTGEDADEFINFRDKTDWLQSSLDTMQLLISQSVGQQMQKKEGSGVILTSDEILNGTQGIRNDLPNDIIDKFLKIYPELDTELTEESLDEIEEKLSLDDGQFDPWLQENLPELTGQSDVDEVLDNDMFMPFEPMGGEEAPVEGAGPDTSMEFGDFLDEFSGESTTPEYQQAEQDVVGPELNEFPNIEGGAPLPPEEEAAPPAPPRPPVR